MSESDPIGENMAKEIQSANQRATLVDRLQSAWDGWFNPSKPMPPMAPQGTLPRQFDFTQSRNLIWTPRGYESISFHHLRAMADGCYLIRVIIEKMKDRIASKSWHFRLKAKPGELQAETKERSNGDPRIIALTNFFQFPDSVLSFAKWTRMLLEDRLVIDAATIEVQRTRGGQILNLLPVDGATINVLIDNTGRRPQYPLPAYQQIVHGLIASDFTTSDLLYMPANVRNHKLYGYSPVEYTLAIMVTLIYKTVYQQIGYTDSDIPLAYMPMPAAMSTDEMIRYMREFEAHLAGNLEKRSKVYPVPDGSKIAMVEHSAFEAKFEEWAARVFAFALGETATPFVQQNNRATAQQSDDTREESGEQPLVQWFKGEIDSIVQRPDLFNAPDIEFLFDEDAETDILKQAQVDQINIEIGTRVADELRARDGLSAMWEDSGGNPPQPSMAVSDQEDLDEPEDEDEGDSGNKPKPKPGKKKVAKAAGLKKKLRY